MTQTLLWRSARQIWPDLVASWNEEGIRWRDWSWSELVWILHRRNIRIIGSEEKSQMRKYLTATHDWAYLRMWDNEQMRDKFTDNNSSS